MKNDMPERRPDGSLPIPEEPTEQKKHTPPPVPPVPMDRATALAIRGGLIQQHKGLLDQARGIASIIAELERA